MVDIMPTLLALAGGKGRPRPSVRRQRHVGDVADGKPSPHDEILINVEAFRGAIRKGDWKLVEIALFPGKTELYNLAVDPEEKNNVADQHPDIVKRAQRAAGRLRPRDEAKRVDQGAAGLPRAQCKRSSTRTSTSTTAGSPHEKPRLPNQ